MHLQDAYFSEKDDVGKPSEIGYKAPASAVFTYNAADTQGEFTATNNNDLDDCTANSEWKIKSEKGGAGGGLKHTPTNPCPVLTPSFDKIGEGTKPST